ncbi:MAG: endonuclease III [Nitrososphaerota archaeon]
MKNYWSKEKFIKVLKILKKEYKYILPLHIKQGDPFKTLIGCILSQRTRDEITNEAYNRLFSKFKSMKNMAIANTNEIIELIKPVGFYKQKAERIKKICNILLEKYNGKIPSNREELMELPGVGNKTADIVLSYGFGKPEIAIDTHVECIAKRLGIVKEKADYIEIKKALEIFTPINMRKFVNIIFVIHGKKICQKRKPKCGICSIKEYCKWFKEKEIVVQNQ